MATAITNPMHLTPTAKGDIFTWGGSDWIKLAVGTNNYLLGADSGTSSGLNYFHIIAGTNMTITPGSGTLTFDASGGGGMTWNEVTGTSQAMVAGSAYWSNNGSLVTMTLPTTAAKNSVMAVAGYGAGGWKIAQNANQKMYLGTSTTTTGTGGSIVSTATKDAIAIILCTVEDLEFVCFGVEGNPFVT